MRILNDFSSSNFFLSNDYIVPITYENTRYPSAEHAFQAAQTLNIAARRQVAKAPTPEMARNIARHLVVRPDWEGIKVGVMRDIVTLKFEHPGLREKLLGTMPAKIVYGNDSDSFWGAVNGSGKNWLGRILTELRATIKRSEDKTG